MFHIVMQVFSQQPLSHFGQVINHSHHSILSYNLNHSAVAVVKPLVSRT